LIHREPAEKAVAADVIVRNARNLAVRPLVSLTMPLHDNAKRHQASNPDYDAIIEAAR
jgi:gamma-glutamyl:cysteine ligase YbdK (ATP-grasp superfamily)